MINAFEMDDNLHMHDLKLQGRQSCQEADHPDRRQGGRRSRNERRYHLHPAAGLMLTGMPISISLGLTVLSFLFLFTQVPLEVGGPEAVHRHREVRDHGHPVLHPGRQLPDPRRGGETDDPLRLVDGRALVRRSRSRRRARLRLFAAVSGSSPATVVAIGSILLPAMVKAGFPNKFGAGVITTSGALGILIPPSIVMVMYSVATNTSVGALFMAGVIPGIGLACVLGGVTWYRAKKFDYPRMPKATFGERWKAFRESVWGLLLIVVVMGGIYSGMFTPTEAAAMSAVYAFFVAVFVYKDLSMKDVPRVLLNSANMSAMLLYIITNAVLFSFIMTNENIPQALADWMLGHGLGMIAFLLAVQHHPAAGRQLHGAVVDRADLCADPVPGGDEAGHRSGALRHPDGGEHGSRHVSPAGRPQPLRGLGDHQDGDYRTDRRGLAVAAVDARLPGRGDLLARPVDLAAEDISA
jgi:C4-dicarboxylate transporter DctM subunit